MKFWKVATLIALAAIPLLLMNNNKKEKGLRPESGDPDNIFEHELTAD